MQVVIVLIHLLTAGWCAGECVSAVMDLRGRFPKFLMFASLGLIHGLVPALTPSWMHLAQFSERSRLHAALLALVGVILFSLGWRLYEFARPRFFGLSAELSSTLNMPQGQTLLRRLFWLCTFVGFAAWAVSVLATGTGVWEVFQQARFAARTYEEHYAAAIAQYFVVLSIVPGFVGFFLPRRYMVAGTLYAVGMAALLFLASQGSRANSMGLLGALVMGYTLRRKVSVPRGLGVAAAAFGMLVLSVALYDVRRSMSRQTYGEMLSTIVSPATYQGALSRDPLNYHEFLVAAVEYFPDRHPFLHGAAYRRLLVFFLPRRYFANIKPEDPNMVFAAMVEPGSARELTTIPPTMMGDGYINFWGWPGILLMFFNGAVFGLVQWKVRTSLLWFVSIGALYARLALLAVRGQPYEVFLMGVWTLVILWVLGRLCGFSFAARPSSGVRSVGNASASQSAFHSSIPLRAR